MNSIYIESDKILARKDIVEWLDGCGAKWISGRIFSKKTNIINPYIVFSYSFFSSPAKQPTSYTHCQTPEQFCEGVAKIMGIPEPTFGGVDISKTETTTEPKGMAIEVSLLGEEDKKELCRLNPVFEGLISAAENNNCALTCNEITPNWFPLVFCRQNGITITDSPKVFMEYVAQQTGKEYEPKLVGKEFTATFLDESGELDADAWDRIKTSHLAKQFPHKTYRILDSLDGIPLDTRFKLSEWIPPVGQKVLLITKDWFLIGYFDRIESKIIFQTGQGVKALNLDGHWMRIV